jgi:hypothetical protein
VEYVHLSVSSLGDLSEVALAALGFALLLIVFGDSYRIVVGKDRFSKLGTGIHGGLLVVRKTMVHERAGAAGDGRACLLADRGLS